LEDASSLATVSSSTITCTVYVPYSWLVPAASSTIINTFSGSYSIQMSNAAGVLPSSVRYSEATFLSGKIPATGTITKVTMNAVI
jgi:hypothetical protein